MKSPTNLFDCFYKHLMNLQISAETHELFTAQVLEDYILKLGSDGITLGNYAEDVYSELQEEVLEMLNKIIYGHYNLDAYRAKLRDKESAA